MQAERAHQATLREDIDVEVAHQSALERERASMTHADRESQFVRARSDNWSEIAAIIADDSEWGSAFGDMDD